MTTLLVGLTALLFAYLTIDADTVGEFTRYNNEIRDEVAFARAGAMHNFSYAGGLLGILSGGVTIFWLRKKQARSIGLEK